MILQNCKLIPFLTEGSDHLTADITIQDGLIQSIDPAGSAKLEGHELLDLAGATVMPGLIDMHVHLFMVGSMYEMQMQKPLDRVFDCYRYAKAFLEHGYTTVRDVGDAVECPTVTLSRAIANGVVDGPRVVTSCATICPHEPGVEVLEYIIAYLHGGRDDMRAVVRQNFHNGAEFIKLYGSGSMMAVGSEPGLRILEADEIDEAVKMAKNKNSYVAIHAHGADAIDVAVRNGVRTIEHASFISQETVDFMVNHKGEAGIVPTLSVFFELMNQPSDTIGADFFAQRAKERVGAVLSSLKYAYDKGLTIGLGTDISLAEFLAHPYGEVQIRKDEMGFSNEEILKQATINGAKLMMMDDEIGSVKVGKLADLIVLKGNPAENLEALYAGPKHVIKSGKLII